MDCTSICTGRKDLVEPQAYVAVVTETTEEGISSLRVDDAHRSHHSAPTYSSDHGLNTKAVDLYPHGPEPTFLDPPSSEERPASQNELNAIVDKFVSEQHDLIKSADLELAGGKTKVKRNTLDQSVNFDAKSPSLGFRSNPHVKDKDRHKNNGPDSGKGGISYRLNPNRSTSRVHYFSAVFANGRVVTVKEWAEMMAEKTFQGLDAREKLKHAIEVSFLSKSFLLSIVC